MCLFLFATVRLQTVSLASSASSAFLISPSPVTVGVNGNVTVTVNVTDAEGLDAWQVVLVYNGTGLKLNSMWVPSDNVFAGHITTFDPVRTTTDGIDGLDYSFTAAVLFDADNVNVTNGVMCKANFAVLSAGVWSIMVGTSADGWDSNWINMTSSYDVLPCKCTVFALNETVTNKVIGPIVPLNSTSLLTLQNFTVTSEYNISSLSFDPSVSILSFTDSVPYTADFDFLNISIPSSITENSSLAVTVKVNGKSFSHYYFGSSSEVWSVLVDPGVHVVTLNIDWIDPPASALPEFSMPTILLSLVMLTLCAFALCRKRRIFKRARDLVA